MNFKKFINSDYLKNNPLCGIDTHKDTLNLATGACIRQIKKLVLTGDGDWTQSGAASGTFYCTVSGYLRQRINITICSHYTSLANINGAAEMQDGNVSFYANVAHPWEIFYVRDSNLATVADLKSYLAAQYAAGTPVTVWYVLAEPTTETITVPSGLSGTEEGYLIQDDTPTPTNPIYPTANTVEKWFNLNHYIMKTATDTITSLPAVLYPTGTTATVGLKGQTVQSSTPSPSSPVMPNGTGERTENLFDKSKRTDNSRVVYTTGEIGSLSGVFVSDFIPIEPNTTYTLNIVSSISGKTGHLFALYDENKNFVNTGAHEATPATVCTFTTPTNVAYIRFNGNMASVDEIMLNSGSTALPYEPYGYKIPILSASTTTPVYLGEVESTRRIKKIVFDGTEDIREGTENYYLFITDNGTPYSSSLCTHTADGTSINNNGTALFFKKSVFVHSSLADFKTYLQQQYAAGTPVTVWYVLATEETAVVNEPLMKIGNFADEVSNISIPVTAGGDTLSVDTTVQPSEVTVNYKGWHPVADVHEFIGNYTIGAMQTLPISELETHTISELQGGKWS